MKSLRRGVRPLLVIAPVLLFISVITRWFFLSSNLATLDVRPSRANVQKAESSDEIVQRWDPEDVLKSLPYDRESIKRSIPAFFDVWNRRPLKSNKGGMGFHHQFMLWYTARILKPKLIVESGMKSGATTWLLHDAVPSARIISFDPIAQTDWVHSSGAETCIVTLQPSFVHAHPRQHGVLLTTHIACGLWLDLNARVRRRRNW
jgi:hypothetical protein